MYSDPALDAVSVLLRFVFNDLCIPRPPAENVTITLRIFGITLCVEGTGMYRINCTFSNTDDESWHVPDRQTEKSIISRIDRILTLVCGGSYLTSGVSHVLKSSLLRLKQENIK